jgi:predicted nucleic acid-binding protein
MRLMVLDTNVVVSAAIGLAGPPAHLIRDWALRGLTQVVTCPVVIKEYREVVRREKFRQYGFPPSWLEYMIADSLHLPDPAVWPHSIPDPKDAPFLALAKTAGAWLVTGNLKHFPRTARNGVTVLSPADYLSHLEESESIR